MDQRNFFEKLNSKVLIVIFAFILVFILLLLVSIFIKPSEPIIDQNIHLTPTAVPYVIPSSAQIPTSIIKKPETVRINRLGEVTFSFPHTSFIEKATLYTFTPTPITINEARTLANILNFKDPGKESSTNNGAAMSFINATSSLIVYLDQGNIQYYSGTQDQARNVSTQNEVIRIAESFIDNLGSYSSKLEVDSSSIFYFSGTGDLRKVENFEEADVYDVPFAQKINNLLIYTQFGISSVANVWVDKSSQIKKFTFNIPDALTASRNEPLISINEAKDKIINGEGVIASYGDLDQYGTLPAPEKTVFNYVEIGYLRDSDNKILYPIFVFKGNSTLEDQSLPIIVYLNATR